MEIELKKCKIGCGENKAITEFYSISKNECKKCARKRMKEYRLYNLEKIRKKDREEYYENSYLIINKRNTYYKDNKNNKIERNISKEEWKEQNNLRKHQNYEKYKNEQKIKNKEYYIQNRNEILQNTKIYAQNNKEQRNKNRRWRYSNEPEFRLRDIISKVVKQSLKSKGLNKNGSYLNYFIYTIKELKNHIENQFKIVGNEWMNWNNQGKYDLKTWDDNNSNTWKWQLDHIIPQSLLPYISMKDENFKKCWALENLRPLSAKQNIIDGASRSRHNKERI